MAGEESLLLRAAALVGSSSPAVGAAVIVAAGGGTLVAGKAVQDAGGVGALLERLQPGEQGKGRQGRGGGPPGRGGAPGRPASVTERLQTILQQGSLQNFPTVPGLGPGAGQPGAGQPGDQGLGPGPEPSVEPPRQPQPSTAPQFGPADRQRLQNTPGTPPPGGTPGGPPQQAPTPSTPRPQTQAEKDVTAFRQAEAKTFTEPAPEPQPEPAPEPSVEQMMKGTAAPDPQPEPTPETPIHAEFISFDRGQGGGGGSAEGTQLVGGGGRTERDVQHFREQEGKTFQAQSDTPEPKPQAVGIQPEAQEAGVEQQSSPEVQGYDPGTRAQRLEEGMQGGTAFSGGL